ncbi:MarR family winged helix-turn-helix transcriptional regulator [Bacillus massiliigorillae]|uniref:MarR family winged helix-turn-helix transcriptional regulator n=1 Tax=Bacillus massiliigorillae TaxID=1243664 RepID=UPI00039C92CF|nr:MarR family transcriptional regulator [Bacillus massiliigorillae]
MNRNTLSSLIWLRLARFASHSNHLSNEYLKRFNLTAAQFDVLVQIQVYQPITQSELAEKIIVTQGGISRMLVRLEKEGYIVRKQEWKTKYICLTDKGNEIIEHTMPHQLVFQSSFFDDVLSEDEKKTLYSLISRVQKSSLKKELPPE